MKFLLSISLLMAPFSVAVCQTTGDFRSHQSGNWNLTSTWDRWDGSVWINPSPGTPSASSGAIEILNGHTITVTASLTVDQVTLDPGSTLVVNSGRTLTISGPADGLSVMGTVNVVGTLTSTAAVTHVLEGGTIIRQQGSTINSTTATLLMQSGSHFRHLSTSPSTALTAAAFDPASTLWITGFTGGGSFNSLNWRGPFGNLVYDCPNQGAGSVNLAGWVQRINGRMEILNTGATGRVYMNSVDSSTQFSHTEIRVAGDLKVAGTSRFFLTSTGKVEMLVGGNFQFNPVSAAASQCATSGWGLLSVAGQGALGSGTFDFASVSSGVGILELSGNVTTSGCAVIKSGGSSASARIRMIGVLQSQKLETSGLSETNFDLEVNNDYGVKLMSDFDSNGTLSLLSGSFYLMGVALNIHGPVFQSGGSLDTDSTGRASVVIDGSGSLPADLTISRSAVFDSFQMSRVAAVVQTSSDFSILHLLTVNAGSMVSQGTIRFGQAVILGSGAKTLRHIVVPVLASLTCAENVTITGNLMNDGLVNFAAGMLNLAGDSLNFTGSSRSTQLATCFVSQNTKVVMQLPVIVSGALTVNGILYSNDSLTVGGSMNISATGNWNPEAPTRLSGLTVSSGGILTAGSHAALWIGGNLSVNGDFFSNGKTLFDGTTVMTGTGSKIFNDISIIGTLTPNAAYSVSGSLVLAGTGTLRPGNNTTTFNGSQSLVTNEGAGTLEFNRLTIAVASSLMTHSFFKASGTVTCRGTLISMAGFQAVGALRVSAGTGVFKAFGGPVSVGGTLTVSSGGSFASAEEVVVDLGANVSATGTLSVEGKATFSGSTILSGSGMKTIQDVIISGTLTPNSTWHVGGDLDVSGVLNSGTGTIYFEGSTTISGTGNMSMNHVTLNPGSELRSSPRVIVVTGNWVNHGVFDPNQGTIVFAGNMAKSITGSVSKMTFNNIAVEDGTSIPDLTFEVDIDLLGVLNLTGKAVLDVDGVTNSRIFTLRSTGDNPATDASIGVLPDSSSILGKLCVERFMSGEGRMYRYVANPLVGPTVADWQKCFPVTGKFSDPSGPAVICGRTIVPGSASLFYYDEPLRKYVAYPASGFAVDNPLAVGKGFAAFIRKCDQPTIISATGLLVDGVNRGHVSIPVSHTSAVLDFNNLVGNPFPSAIIWDSASLTHVSSTIAIRDNGKGVFQYYTRGGDQSGIPHGAIALGQAFWIRTTGPNPVLEINEKAKCPSPSSSGNIFYRKLESDFLIISVLDQREQILDKTYLVVSPEGKEGPELDDLDAPKLNNQIDDPFTELPDLFTQPSYGQALAVNAFANIPCGTGIPITLRDARPGYYRFRFESQGQFRRIQMFIWDEFNQRKSRVADGMPFDFQVTSLAPYRYTLYFEEMSIDIHPDIESTSLICGQDTARVELRNAVDDFRYRLVIGVTGDTLATTSNPAVWKIPSSRLSEGENIIRILATGYCGRSQSIGERRIRKISIPTFTVNENYHCGPGEVELTASVGLEGWTYFWYRDSLDVVPAFSGSTYVTPWLKRTTSFFVTIADSSGNCQSGKTKVNATIIPYQKAVMALVAPNYLQSSSSRGNHWYLEGITLPDTTSLIRISKSGLYRLEVTNQNCFSFDEKLIVLDESRRPDRDIKVYPNPTTGKLFVTVSSNYKFINLKVLSGQGIYINSISLPEFGGNHSGNIDLTGFSSGLYFLDFEFEDQKVRLKVVRE